MKNSIFRKVTRLGFLSSKNRLDKNLYLRNFSKSLENYFGITSPDTGKTTTYETSGYLEAMTDSERKKLGDELNKTARERYDKSKPKTKAEEEARKAAEAATAKRKAEEAARKKAEAEAKAIREANMHKDDASRREHDNLGKSSAGAGVGGFGGGGGGGIYPGGRAKGGLMKRK